MNFRNRQKIRRIKKYFKLFFKNVEVSNQSKMEGFLFVHCKGLYLTRLCSVQDTAKKKEAVYWISDLLDAYLEEQYHAALGARPVLKNDGTVLFTVSEKGGK